MICQDKILREVFCDHFGLGKSGGGGGMLGCSKRKGWNLSISVKSSKATTKMTLSEKVFQEFLTFTRDVCK